MAWLGKVLLLLGVDGAYDDLGATNKTVVNVDAGYSETIMYFVFERG
jgi:hypothetical protein